MRCKEVQEGLEESRTETLPVPILEHLAKCSACQAHAQDWRLLRAGFRALAEEQAPAASLGFEVRLVRRLEEATEEENAGAEFLERVGRRVVYASSLLALLALLALALPASGPLRGPATADLLLALPEAALHSSDAVFAEELAETPRPAPTNSDDGAQKNHR